MADHPLTPTAAPAGRLAAQFRRALEPDWDQLFPVPARWVAGVLAVLAALALRDPLANMVHWWWTKSNWNHGFLVPLFALYLLHVRRANLVSLHARPSWLGVGFVLASLGVYVGGIVLMFGMVQWVSVWLMAIAVTWTAGGWALVRRAAVPLGYLVLAIPWSDRIYFQVTMPMRLFASQVTGWLLSWVPGLQVNVSGVVLEITRGQQFVTLNVADACAGMHMLVALMALAVAVAFVSPRPAWQRAILIGVGVPIAIAVNVVRVFITALIHIYVGAEYAEGTWHTLLGLAMLPLALGLLMGVQWVLEHLVVEERAETRTRLEAGPAAAAAPVAAPPPPAPVPAPAPAPTPTAVRLTAPAVLAAVVILGAFAAGKGPALAAFQVVLTKDPIPLVRPLTEFPTGEVMRPFVVQDKAELSESVIESLGTRDFILWMWRDPQANPRGQLDANLTFFVSYDTGKQDSVPHVPEECYLGGGYQPIPTLGGAVAVKVPGLGLKDDELTLTLLAFQHPKLKGVVRYVAYVFNINNRWVSGRQQARWEQFKTEKYYFRSKVELAVLGKETAREDVIRLFERFLQRAAPVLVADFWPDVSQGPRPGGGAAPASGPAR